MYKYYKHYILYINIKYYRQQKSEKRQESELLSFLKIALLMFGLAFLDFAYVATLVGL